MNLNKEWLILKIFPNCNQNNSAERVWRCGDLFLQNLENIARGSKTYHLYYNDVPEGPHFKFFVKTQDTKKFLEWKKCNESNTELLRIESSDDSDKNEHKQGIIARCVFESVKDIGKLDMIKLKSKLQNNKIYSELDYTGKHYLRNMLKMTYSEEKNLLD